MDESPFITSSTQFPPRGMRCGWPVPKGTGGGGEGSRAPSWSHGIRTAPGGRGAEAT